MIARMHPRTAPFLDGESYGLRVEVAERRGAHVVSLIGEAGVWNTAPLESAIGALLAREPCHVVIDLADCTLLSSLAIAAIISLHRGVRVRGGVIRLAAAEPPVLEIIHTLRLEQLFPVHATVTEALGAAGGTGRLR